MNAVQKAAFAASAFAITLVGAAFVTAPMAFARPEPRRRCMPVRAPLQRRSMTPCNKSAHQPSE